MFAPKDKTRPCLLLAYTDSAQAARCARQCRRQGWEVHQTRSGREARRLAGIIEPIVVVLDVDLADESGWLTAAKLLLERPRQKILLAGAEHTPRRERFARFVGAARFITRAETMAALEDHLHVLVST